MTHEEVESEVKDIIASTLAISVDQVTMESHIRDDLGADSIDQTEIVIELEETFDFQISDEVAQTFQTVGAIVSYIEMQNIK